MISNHTLGLLVNVFLHVLILLIFLTVLFFTVISKKEKKEIESQAKNGIESGITKLLDKIPKNRTLPPKIWENVINEMNKAEIKYKDNNPETDKNNKTILTNVIIIISMLFCVVVFYMIYISIVKKKHIGIKYILIDNFFIFLILGSLEFIFFWYIIQHYIPIYPQDAEIEVLEHIQSYF